MKFAALTPMVYTAIGGNRQIIGVENFFPTRVLRQNLLLAIDINRYQTDKRIGNNQITPAIKCHA